MKGCADSHLDIENCSACRRRCDKESSVFGRTICDTWVSYTQFSPVVLAQEPRVSTTCPEPLHSGVLTSNQRCDLLITSPTPNTVVLLRDLQYTVGHKSETTNSWPKFCKILTDYQKFYTGKVAGKFAVKWLLRIPPHNLIKH